VPTCNAIENLRALSSLFYLRLRFGGSLSLALRCLLFWCRMELGTYRRVHFILRKRLDVDDLANFLLEIEALFDERRKQLAVIGFAEFEVEAVLHTVLARVLVHEARLVGAGNQLELQTLQRTAVLLDHRFDFVQRCAEAANAFP